MVAAAAAAAAKRATGVKASPEEAAAHAAALSLVQVQYKNWDVVWSRMAGFPWWPGIVFLDWDVVKEAELPLPKELLTINAPEQREVTVTVHGKREVRTVTDRFCLVMFLDKGDWFAANMTTQIQPFTSNYNANFKPTHKRGKTAGFKQAVYRAIKLLHLSTEHTEEELALFNTPPQEKRRRVEPKTQPKKQSGARGEDSEWEDEYESSEHDNDDDADFAIEKPVLPAKLKSRGKAPQRLDAELSNPTASTKVRVQQQGVKKPKQASSSRQNGVAVIYDDEADQKVSGKGRKKMASKAISAAENSHAAAQTKDSLSQKKAPKKKASSKAVHDEALDVSRSVSSKKLAETDADYRVDKRKKESRQQLKSESKNGVAAGKKVSAKKKKAPAEMSNSAEDDDDGDVELIESPNRTKDESSAGGSAPAQSSTPLSQIWTTHADEKHDASSTDAKKTLVYKQDFVWDEELFTNNEEVIIEKREDEDELVSSARDRPLGKRQMRSVQQSQIRQNLMTGNLDPHTMVQCESYRSRDDLENLNSRSRGSSSLEPPFQIQVHPDAVFVCDLHAHLATCEIIGFLGGRWDEGTKSLYIQAAFPCRSLMIDGDDGSTDVEMDPGSEIELREIIQNAQLEVVGWYHSHPAFAPDPSIRDIENQTSYQQLFQRRTERQTDEQESVVEISEPFVGLIVGTYDTKRDTPVSLFRYFHTRGEKVSGGARREIFMPYELVPTRRHYRAVLSAEQRAEICSLTMYPSVFDMFFGNQSATGLKSVELPRDNDVTVAFAGTDAIVPSSKKDTSLAQSRKRKLSSDLVVKAEIAVKKGKGKRGRKRKTDLIKSVEEDGGRIDLTGDDVESPASDQSAPQSAAVEVDGDDGDEMTISAVPEASSSTPDVRVVQPSEAVAAQVSSPAVDEAQIDEAELESQGDATVTHNIEPEVVAIVVESPSAVEPIATAEPSTTEVESCVEAPEVTQSPKEAQEMKKETEQKRRSTSFDTADRRRSRRNQPLPDATTELVVDTQPVTINLVEEEVDDETTLKEAESAEVISVTPPSFALDSNSGSSGGRRRGRKPVQTQKKSTTFFNSASTRDDRSPHTSQSGSVATQIAVYGAFGSASGVTMVGAAEKEDGALQAKIKEESSFANAVVTPASEDKYVYLVFNTSKNDEKDAVPVDKKTRVLETVASLPTSVQGVKELLSQATVEVQQIQDDESGQADSKASQDSPQSRSSTEAISVTMEIDDGDSSQTVSAENDNEKAPQGFPQSSVAVEESVSMETDDGDIPQDSSEPLVLPDAGGARAQEQIIVSDEQPVSLGSASKSVERGDHPATPLDDDDMIDPEEEPTTQLNRHEVLALSDVTSSAPPSESRRGDTATSSPDAAAEAKVCEECPVLLADSSQTTELGQEVAPDVKLLSKDDSLVDISVAEPASLDLPPHEASSGHLEDKVVKSEAESDIVMAESSQAHKQHEEQEEEPVKEEAPLPPPPTAMLFGSGRQVEDIRTSLDRIKPLVEKMKGIREAAAARFDTESAATRSKATEEDAAGATSEVKPDVDVGGESNLFERQQAHLHSLRTKYGNGIGGCAEQVITLVDYYRDFERRIDLNETWKAKVNKLSKIEASMSEYVRYVNLPVHLRQEFVQDVVGYLQLSWELTRPAN